MAGHNQLPMTEIDLDDDKLDTLAKVLELNASADCPSQAIYWDEDAVDEIEDLQTDIEAQA